MTATTQQQQDIDALNTDTLQNFTIYFPHCVQLSDGSTTSQTHFTFQIQTNNLIPANTYKYNYTSQLLRPKPLCAEYNNIVDAGKGNDSNMYVAAYPDTRSTSSIKTPSEI
jgi:hypothetical protein